MLEFVEASVEPAIPGLLEKMDHALYLIPGMDHAVASIISHELETKLVAAKVFETGTATRAKCEAWSRETKHRDGAHMSGINAFAQTTHIINQVLTEDETEIDEAVDPDYVPKRQVGR